MKLLQLPSGLPEEEVGVTSGSDQCVGIDHHGSDLLGDDGLELLFVPLPFLGRQSTPHRVHSKHCEANILPVLHPHLFGLYPLPGFRFHSGALR